VKHEGGKQENRRMERAFLSKEFELSIINPFYRKSLEEEAPDIEEFCGKMGYGWVCQHLGYDKINIKVGDIPQDILNVWNDYVTLGRYITLFYAGYAYDFDENKWTISTLRAKPRPIKSFVVTEIPPPPEEGGCVMSKGFLNKGITEGIFLTFLFSFLIRILTKND
jgi:hypothetical protein